MWHVLCAVWRVACGMWHVATTGPKPNQIQLLTHNFANKQTNNNRGRKRRRERERERKWARQLQVTNEMKSVCQRSNKLFKIPVCYTYTPEGVSSPPLHWTIHKKICFNFQWKESQQRESTQILRQTKGKTARANMKFVNNGAGNWKPSPLPSARSVGLFTVKICVIDWVNI